MRITLFTLLLVALRIAGAQPAAVVPTHQEVRWDERGGAALRTHVAPRSSVEWCSALRTGDAVDWEFESGDPLDANVHWHEGSATHYPVQKDSVQLWSGRLVASGERVYCWMWTNRSSTPVALQARVQRTLRAG